jgi:hypothetical protein
MFISHKYLRRKGGVTPPLQLFLNYRFTIYYSLFTAFFRFRFAYRAEWLPQVQGADMPSFRAAYTLVNRLAADLADFHEGIITVCAALFNICAVTSEPKRISNVASSILKSMTVKTIP